MIKIHRLEKRKKQYGLSFALKKIDDEKDLVKISLNCAKSCFSFINLLGGLAWKEYANKCIQAVDQWLLCPNEESVKNLYEIYTIKLNAVGEYSSLHFAHACNAFRKSVKCCWRAGHHVDDKCFDGVRLLTKSVITHTSIAIEVKRIHYHYYVLSLLRSTTLNKSKLQTKGKIADKSTLMALLDELNEMGEDIICQTNDEFNLNKPCHMNIKPGKTMDQLVDNIWKNPIAIHYLEHLYS